MEHIRIKYFYIENGNMFAVADNQPLDGTAIFVDGPSRIFRQEIEVTEDNSHILRWVEYNYR